MTRVTGAPVLGLLLILCLPTAPGAAQPAGPAGRSSQLLQHDVSVALKLIQVFVTDEKGNPVPGLAKADFELFDDGKKVEVTDFEDHVSAAAGPADTEAGEEPGLIPPAGPPGSGSPLMPRRFILLFDFAYNNPRGIVQAKTAARHFLETGLHPEDEAGIISISMSRGLAVHETLTTRHDLVAKAVDNLSMKNASGRADEIEEEYWRRQGEGNTNPGGRSPGGKSLFQLNAERQDSKAQASLFLDMMAELARALRQVPGPKHILLFSTGIPESLVYGNRMSQYMVLESGGRVRTIYDAGDSALIRKNEAMLKEFGAASCSLYSFDTREAAMVQSLFTYDSQTLEEGNRAMFSRGGVSQNATQVFKDDKITGLYALRKAAGATGGEYFPNIKEYERSLARVQAATDNYYILGFRLKETQDGRFHKIRVKVKSKDYTVRTQGGYFNPKPYRDYSEFEKRLHLVDQALSTSPDTRFPVEPRMSVLVQAESGKSLVTLFAGMRPEDLRPFAKRRVEFVSLIFDGRDKIVWTDREETTIAEPQGRMGFHVVETTLAPGRYRCRLVARDMDSGESGVSSADVAVGDGAALGLAVDTPLILAEREPPSYWPKAAGTAIPKWQERYGSDARLRWPVFGPLPRTFASLFVALACSYGGLESPDLVLTYQLIDSQTGRAAAFPLLGERTDEEPGRTRKRLEFSVRDLPPGTYFFYARAVDRKSQSVAFSQTTLTILPPET